MTEEVIQEVQTEFINGIKEDTKEFVGIQVNKEALEHFWRVTCPCGITVVYPVNKLPTETTLHPCGNPNHYTVKITD